MVIKIAWKTILAGIAAACAGLLLLASSSSAAIHTEDVEYKDDGVVLEGYLAYDDAIKVKRPGIMLIHEWTGIGDYIKKRAQNLAKLGYIAFAADMYGKGVRAKNPAEASKLAGIYRSDRQLMRSRVNAGLEELKKQKFFDTKRSAAIGYCFGGGVVLELARSGADVAGVVSFHGNLDTQCQKDAKNIKAKVLVLHGADDPHVPLEQVAGFMNEMRAAGVDWQIAFYGNAVHSFTNPGAGNDPSKGSAYNEKADIRSWGAMKGFFKEIFSEKEL